MGAFSTLFKSYNQVYAEGSPLIICARALVKNNESGSLFAQLKFRNISSKTIKVVKVSVKALDSFGNETETIEGYQYLDFSAKRNAEFGNKQLIPIKDRNSRSFVAKCTEVLFEDGTSVSAPEEAEWTEIFEQKKLETVFGAALAGQYRRDTFAKAEFVPDYEKDIWRCACGGINKNFENRCNICHNEKDFQYLALDRETLERNFEEFRKGEAEKAEKARIERERKAEETRIAEEKRKKKIKTIASIVTPIAVAIVAAIVIFTTVIQPLQKYNEALDLMRSGEYVKARTRFTEIPDFKNSSELMKECTYRNALSLLEDGYLTNAVKEFRKVEDYKDSAEKIDECFVESYGNIYLQIKDGVKPGDVITMGTYEQDNNTDNGKEEIEWYVISNNGKNICLLTKYVIEGKRFDSGERSYWSGSEIKPWLNGTFYKNVFTDKEKKIITLNGTDKIFLLTDSQVKSMLWENELGMAEGIPTAYAVKKGLEKGGCDWWLSSTNDGRPEHVMPYLSVTAISSTASWEVDDIKGVRPAMWIDISVFS